MQATAPAPLTTITAAIAVPGDTLVDVVNAARTARMSGRVLSVRPIGRHLVFSLAVRGERRIVRLLPSDVVDVIAA